MQHRENPGGGEPNPPPVPPPVPPVPVPLVTVTGMVFWNSVPAWSHTSTVIVSEPAVVPAVYLSVDR